MEYIPKAPSLLDLEWNEQHDIKRLLYLLVKIMDVTGNKHKRKSLCQNMVFKESWLGPPL